VDDIVPGKGKGLVILLYGMLLFCLFLLDMTFANMRKGPPGVGKTSTAETIAVATGKTSFSISVTDVGTKARHVEANLSRILFSGDCLASHLAHVGFLKATLMLLSQLTATQ
jgi:hypothetical protein